MPNQGSARFSHPHPNLQRGQEQEIRLLERTPNWQALRAGAELRGRSRPDVNPQDDLCTFLRSSLLPPYRSLADFPTLVPISPPPQVSSLGALRGIIFHRTSDLNLSISSTSATCPSVLYFQQATNPNDDKPSSGLNLPDSREIQIPVRLLPTSSPVNLQAAVHLPHDVTSPSLGVGGPICHDRGSVLPQACDNLP